MRISDWSSDVCSSDLESRRCGHRPARISERDAADAVAHRHVSVVPRIGGSGGRACGGRGGRALWPVDDGDDFDRGDRGNRSEPLFPALPLSRPRIDESTSSEEHTSELQSLMRISYAVFCLKKQNYDLHL